MLTNMFPDGHEDLPSGWKKSSPTTQGTQRVRRKRFVEPEVREFFNNVKNRFADDVKGYREFLDVFIQFANGVLVKRQLYVKIGALLFGHDDLLHQFEGFFNHASENGRSEIESFRLFAKGDCSNLAGVSTVEAMKERPPEQLTRHRRITLLKPSAVEYMEERKSVAENALGFIAQVKQTFCQGNRQNEKYDQFVGALLEFRQQKIGPALLASKLLTVFEGHDDLLRGFKMFLPKSVRGNGISSRIKRKSFRRQSSIDFINTVKTRFAGNPRSYEEILDAIAANKHENFNLPLLCAKVVDLFFGHTDLIYQFQRFFDDCSENFRREVAEQCGFAIDDRLELIEVTLCNLRTSIACAEKASEVPDSELSKFVEEEFVGVKLMGIKRTFCESSRKVIEDLRKNPGKALHVILQRCREKEKAVSMDRSAALQFLGEIRVLHGNRNVKKRLRLE